MEEDGITRNVLTKNDNSGNHYKGDNNSHNDNKNIPGTNGSDNGSFWHIFTGSGANNINVYGYGVTLRLAGATGAVTLDASFSPMSLGGLIVADSDSASYTLGRASGNNVIHFLASSATGAKTNMYIGANTTLNGSGYSIEAGGTWKVASGKTLDFTRGNVTVNSGVDTIISGGGTVKFSTAVTNNGNLMVASGSTMELANTVSGSGKVGGYVDAVSRGAGSISNFIKVGSDTIYDSMSGRLQLFSADYVKLSNVNITRSGDYISATYTSSLVLDWTNGDETWTSGMTDGWYLAGTTTAYGFQNNDNVRFSSATPQSVAVAGSGVTVAEMSVTGDYTFSGGAVNASALSLDNATLRTGTGGSIRSTSTTVSGTSTISASALSAGVLTVNSGASMVLADGITVESTGLVSSGEAPIANWNNLFSGVSGAGTLKFTTLQKIQPGTGNQTWDASLGSNVQSAPKVQNIVFDKGLYIFGNGQKNVDVNQIMSLYDGANVTVNTDALAIMRVKLLVDGGSVTATNGITIGHTENSNGYRGIVELKSGSISTTNIASVNQSDESAFIMSGGELSLSGSSLFELAVNNSRLQVSLTGGTIQAGADANLVALNGNAADKINFIIGGTQDNPFTIDTQGHSVTLNHDYEQTGTIYAGGNGTLVLDSTINMAHMDDLECSTVHTIGSYTDITNTGNGYLAASYLLVRNTGDATIELGANASFTCSGQEAQIMLLEDDNGTTHAYVSTNSTGGDYYINQGTTTYDAAGNWAYSANTTGLVLNGGDLILNKDLRLDKNDNLVDIYVAQNAKVTVEEGVTLARSNMTFAEGKQVTLAGRGLVDIGTYRDVDFSGLVTTDPAWNGALLIHGKHNTADINFNDIPGLNAMNTTIALMGFTGSGTGNYLAQSNSAFGTNKIMLIGNGEQAFTITNGYSNTIYDIHGLCGTGDFVKKGGAQQLPNTYSR